MFGLIRGWRRRRLAARPLPAEWRAILAERAPHLAAFPADERAQLERKLKLFIWERHWIGAGGLEVTDEMRVVIALAAAELAQGLDDDVYRKLGEIVIYPSHYKHPGDRSSTVFGEVNTFGTMVLSWDAVRHGIENDADGHNTAVHELAHILDGADGTFDGTPPLATTADRHAWAKVFTKRFEELREKPHKSVVRRYGATNEAEFFACATEAFFEKPKQMQKRAPDLYAVLRDYYGVDPAGDAR